MNRPSDIGCLQNAKAMKKMGAPLNTAVVDHKFSLEFFTELLISLSLFGSTVIR